MSDDYSCKEWRSVMRVQVMGEVKEDIEEVTIDPSIPFANPGVACGLHRSSSPVQDNARSLRGPRGG